MHKHKSSLRECTNQKTEKRQAGVVASLKEKFPEIIAISSSEARTGDWENIITAHKDEPFARTWDSSTKRVGRNVLNTIDQGFAKLFAFHNVVILVLSVPHRGHWCLQLTIRLIKEKVHFA